MRTTVAIALLGLVAAVAPPRISLSLNEQALPVDGKDNVEVCEAGSADRISCPYPVATAYDHHDQVVKVDMQVWSLVDDKPTRLCNSAKACKAVVDYTKPGEYLFLYDACDKAGNCAKKGSNKSLEGSQKVHRASVTFNLILKDDVAPVICYNQKVSKHALAYSSNNGALECHNSGFDSEESKIMTVEGGTGSFTLKDSVVHDNVTPTGEMAVAYTVARCGHLKFTDGSAKALDTKCTENQKKFRKLAAVNAYIKQYISGDKKQAGYIQIRMNAKDTAGIYGYNNKDNKAATVVVAVKIVDSVAPKIELKGANPIWRECDHTKEYKDAGAEYSDAVNSVAQLKKSRSSLLWMEKVTVPQYPGRKFIGYHVKGKYSVSYQATDTSGNQARIIRTVNVVDTKKPTITLKNSDEIVTYQNTNKAKDTVVSEANLNDPGVEVEDQCDKFIGQRQVTKTWGKKAFNSRLLGKYTRTYTATDAAGHVSEPVHRDFYVVDLEKPIIKIQGGGRLTFEASHDAEYKDEGATCEDFVDGVLNHRVRVGGDIVDMAVPGKYQIDYTCEDLSGNNAKQVHRIVVVKDTTPPAIVMNGPSTVRVEAGFPYKEMGATATDTLDGNIKACHKKADRSIVGLGDQDNHVVSKKNDCLHVYGNSVNEYYEYFSRQSCRDIKADLKSAKSGRYTITRPLPNSQFAKFDVECDMDAKQTYYLANAHRELKFSERKAFCMKKGFSLPTFKQVDTHFLRQVYPQTWRDLLPKSAKQSQFVCISDDYDLHQQEMLRGSAKDCDEPASIHRCTRAGNFMITYSTKDQAGNRAAAFRTVLVVDTLPPVISLHFKAKSTEGKWSVIQRSAGGSGVNGEANPARLSKYNPNLSGQQAQVVHSNSKTNYNNIQDAFMAETAASFNGWLAAAAASAVAGVALLAASSKKTATSVPV